MMLLTHYSSTIFKKDKVFVSEKYDGWRMLYKKGKFYTRRGTEITLPEKFYKALEEYKDEYEFDGELWMGYGSTSSDISATTITDMEEVKFMIFDIPNLNEPYRYRYILLGLLEFDLENIEVVRQFLCKNEREMNLIYDKVLKRGGEGVVLRLPDEKYQHGKRNPFFQKKKPFSTTEAVVVGYFNSAKGIKIADYVSSLIVRSVRDTKQYKVSFKSTSPPPLGTVITVRYSQETVSGLPKFPVFVGIRNTMDLPLEVKPSNYVVKDIVVDLDHPNCDGVVTKTECEKNGPRPIVAGRHVYYDNEQGRKHRVTCDRKGITVYCTCEAWKYQVLPAQFRTCKHCLSVYDYQPQVPWSVRESAKKKHDMKKSQAKIG